MYDKCYFCLDQLPKLKKESTASFFVNFGGAGVQKSRPTLLYISIIFTSGIINTISHLISIQSLQPRRRSILQSIDYSGKVL